MSSLVRPFARTACLALILAAALAHAAPAGLVVRQQCSSAPAFMECVNRCRQPVGNTVSCAEPDCCVSQSGSTLKACAGSCCGSLDLNTNKITPSNERCPPASSSTTSSDGSTSTSSSSSSSSDGSGGSGRGDGSATTAAPSSSGGGATQKSGSSTCFARSARVELESGAFKSMDQLQIGDRVKVAHGVYSDVFMFTHKTPDVESEFVVIRTDTKHAIASTPGHYIYLNGALAPSQTAKVGDEVFLGSGSTAKVTAVTRSVGSGLYNPQTLHGDIVVDGVIASTYTSAVSPSFGHAWLAPMRAVYKLFATKSLVLENGACSLASVLPDGGLVY